MKLLTWNPTQKNSVTKMFHWKMNHKNRKSIHKIMLNHCWKNDEAFPFLLAGRCRFQEKHVETSFFFFTTRLRNKNKKYQYQVIYPWTGTCHTVYTGYCEVRLEDDIYYVTYNFLRAITLKRMITRFNTKKIYFMILYPILRNYKT